MAKIQKHQKALELRATGKSYSDIKQVLGVSKSTLSLWLRNHPLSESKIRELRDWNQRRIENYKETRRKSREAILRSIYKEERRRINPMSSRDIFVSGLFLYWGEGGKTKIFELSMSNTNPAIIKAFIFWLRRSFGVEKNKIKIKLHLYKDMDINKETTFWAKTLKISKRQLKKPYIKESRFSGLSYKKGFGHGTCNALLGNAIVAKRVMMGLKVLEEFYAGP